MCSLKGGLGFTLTLQPLLVFSWKGKSTKKTFSRKQSSSIERSNSKRDASNSITETEKSGPGGRRENRSHCTSKFNTKN